MGVIVECEHLTKSYGDLVVLNDVSFRVEEGEIIGLVGPNGAGKITLIEMIEGLRTQGKTIFLTTHYMEEAEKLANAIDTCRL